jgi:hypothetical protein
MSDDKNEYEKIARSIFNDMLNNDWESCDQKIKNHG